MVKVLQMLINADSGLTTVLRQGLWSGRSNVVATIRKGIYAKKQCKLFVDGVIDKKTVH